MPTTTAHHLRPCGYYLVSQERYGRDGNTILHTQTARWLPSTLQWQLSDASKSKLPANYFDHIGERVA